MSAPKSVTKLNKNGVTYTSNVAAAEYYIHELTRAALRDVGKFVKKTFREKYYSIFQRHTGDGGKATNYVVLSSKSTTNPRVEIGLKKGKVDGRYSYFQEFGTSKTPKLGLLTASVEENIPTIIEIESKYLSGLESEAEALSLINEKEYSDNEDE